MISFASRVEASMPLVSAMVFLLRNGSGYRTSVGGTEIAPNAWRKQPRDQQDHDGNSNDRPRFDTQSRVDQVSDEIDQDEGDRQPVAPPPAAEQSIGRRGASQADRAEEDRSPDSHVSKGLMSARIQAPHRFEEAARRENGNQGETARERAEDEEGGQGRDSARSIWSGGQGDTIPEP